MSRSPETTTAPWAWSGGDQQLAVRFVGRGPATREAALAAGGAAPRRLAWAEQVHSARVLAARPGRCGRGDALVAHQPGLALAIATADCVPLVLGGPGRLAAVHAGWRGIVAGIVGEAVAALEPATELAAWIGPAIGACCYEVGPEVATQVAAASDETVIRPGTSPRPHLDLVAAVRRQLAARGVDTIWSSDLCTRCSPFLWSYRRDGGATGRNWTLAWLRG